MQAPRAGDAQLRIHHVINSYSDHTGGAEKLVRALHCELIRAGECSDMLGIQHQDDPDLDHASSLMQRGPYHLSTPARIWHHLRSRLRFGDVVHAHLFPSILYVSLLKQLRLINVPVVMTEHATTNSRRGSFIGSLIDWFTYRGYDKIFTVSDGVEAELLRWKPQLEGRTHVILNGINLHFAAPIIRNATKCPIVLSVGSLRDAKNYTRMLQAIASLADFDFEYWIAGEGLLEETLRSHVESLGLGSKVKFLGRVSDLPSVLQRADVFLMASKWEGFGLAAVEAMNASLPLVVSNVPGLAEIVESENDCAIVVDPQDANSISQGIRQLLTCRQKREEMGLNAFNLAGSYTIEKMMRSYLREYAALPK